MNHIYKSIFNKALGVFTAVPEFASAHGKGSERTVVGRVAKGTAGFAASALAISVGLALTSTSAVAYPGIYVNDRQAGNCLAINDAATPNVGVGTILVANTALGIVELKVPGTYAPQTGITPSYYNAAGSARPCVAVGGSTVDNRDTQTNRTLFYGGTGALTEADEINDRDNGAKNLTLGGRLDVNSGIIGVGDRGTNGAGATNSIRMGTGTTLDEANKHKNAIAIGVNTATTAESAVAISTEAKARTLYSIAMGYKAVAGDNSAGALANGASAIAIGNQALANYYNAIALGQKAKVNTGSDGIAIGSETQVNAYKGTAIGAFSEANGSQSLVIGNNVQGKPSVASGVRSQIIGVESNVVGEDATSIGYKNTILAARTYAMGNNINVRSGADDSVVMGSNNTLASVRTYAIGNNINLASNKTTDSLAFGTRAHVSDHDQISLGTDAGADAAATASNANSVAIGQSAGRYAQSGAANTAIGSRSGQYVKGSYNIAMGSNAGSGDATQVLEANNTVAIGNSAKASANNAMAIGIGSKAQAEQTVAFGPYATASGKFSTAIGLQARALGDNAIATGNHAAAVGTQQISIGINAGNSTGSNTSPAKAADYGVFIGRYAGSDAAGATGNAYGVGIGFEAGSYNQGGTNNFAIGSQAGQYVEGSRNASYGQHSGKYIKGSDNVAIGTRAGSGADGDILEAGDTIAIGRDSKASASYATAIGSEAKAKGIDSIAMGHNATASNANSVALGTNSATADVHTGDYTLNDSYTAAGLPNAANGTVSVGSKGKERQIQNVAAGVISATSTDAINGSQLYATNNYLSNFAGGVKKVLGGNAAVDNAGNVTMSNIGGTGENTIDGAIKNLKTAIDSKADTTASVTSKNAADIKVEKETPVGNITNYKLSLGDDAKEKLAKAATALQTVEGDSNITATKDPADPTKVKLALKRDLTADSLTLGDTAGNHAVVNKDGLTIANGPSVKKDGINAGNKKITGVADGNVALGSTDAVNGGQLAEVKSKADSAVQNVVSANPTALTVTKAGDTVTLTPNFIAGDLVNPATGEVNTPAADDADKLVTAGTVAKALAETHFVVDTKATTGGELDGASQANQKIKSSNKVTLQAGKNLKAKQTNGTDGAQVEFSLKDSISLTQVTAGTGDNQVVLGKDGVQVGGNTYINKDGINAAGKAISNVANGNVAAYSKDAVNGGQLHDTAKSLADVIGGGATVKDGKVVAGQNGIGNTGQNTVHGAIAAINQNTANNFNQIRGDLRKMDRDLRGSIAGTLATAGLPQAFSPGKSMVAAAAGTYRGQSGLAIGVSRISDNGKVILKVTGNTNSRGDFGGTIGAGYQW